MTDNTPFKMSQGYDVLPPKSGEAYPIPCTEWDFLKKKVGELSNRPWVLHTIGSILIGGSLSTFISLLLGAISTEVHKNAGVIAWAVFVVTGLCGAVCFFFAEQQHKIQSTQAGDVVTQMELIEARFERRTA